MANELTRSIMANLSGRGGTQPGGASADNRLSAGEEALLLDVMGGKAPHARPGAPQTGAPANRRLSLAELAEQKRQGR